MGLSPQGSPRLVVAKTTARRGPDEYSGAEVDEVETLVVRMRDRIITRLRQNPTSGDTQPQRLSLERLNAVLSLLIDVEYPAAGIQRSAI